MAASGVPSIPLGDVMAGLFYARGEARLQDVLNEFVKQAMQDAFPTSDPDDPYNKEVDKRKAAADERAKRAADLRTELIALGTPLTKVEIGQVPPSPLLPLALACHTVGVVFDMTASMCRSGRKKGTSGSKIASHHSGLH